MGLGIGNKVNKMYIVNAKYYYLQLDQALQKAKNILLERGNLVNSTFKISQGKKGGYCVHLNERWEVVGNVNLLNVIIREVEIQ